MTLTNISDAKAHLSALLERVSRGEEIIIGKAGKPVAKLTRYSESQEPRLGGQLAGKILISDDFDHELPPEVLRAFLGEGG
jgi:prevent-host-death family protein